MDRDETIPGTPRQRSIIRCCCALLILAVAIPCPAIVYSTFIGGSDDDQGNAIAVDSAGNAYLVGEHRLEGEWASVNLIPSFAIRSRFGVS